MLRKNDELCRLISTERAKNPCIKIADLAIGGNDAIAAGIAPRLVGTVMNALLELVLDDPAINTRESLISNAASIYESLKGVENV